MIPGAPAPRLAERRARRIYEAVGITTSPAFRAGTPRRLGFSSFSAAWDPAADGKRFLAPAGKSGPQPYTVVLNWQAGLKK